MAFITFSKKLYALIHIRKYKRVILDFSTVKQAYPNGMVPIISTINSESQNGITFEIVPPKDAAVRSLFQHNGWLYYLDPQNWEPPKISGFSNFPLQRFITDDELNDLVNRSVEVCLQQLVFAEGVPQAFEWALNEIAGNILHHSKADCGWVQVITYKENHKLALMVCDSGIGVPQAMKTRFNFHKDEEALELALRKGVTSTPEFGQGNGLAGVLAIAQNSNGKFALISGRGRVNILEGKVRTTTNYPSFKGTVVDVQFATDSEIDLPKALWGHKPEDYFDTRFEDDKGDLAVRLRDYASSFGNRITGEKIRYLVINLLKQNRGQSVKIIMNDIGVISSSFADELFGKLFIELGPIDFSKLIKFEGINPLCKNIVDNAISQRVAQTVKYITPVE